MTNWKILLGRKITESNWQIGIEKDNKQYENDYEAQKRHVYMYLVWVSNLQPTRDFCFSSNL